MLRSLKKVARMRTMKRPMVALPEDLHRALKMYAAAHDTQVKALVEAAVRDFLKRRGEKS
jgi:plasmid stability protein